jgi:hypothetical protein
MGAVRLGPPGDMAGRRPRPKGRTGTAPSSHGKKHVINSRKSTLYREEPGFLSTAACFPMGEMKFSDRGQTYMRAWVEKKASDFLIHKFHKIVIVEICYSSQLVKI